jgi:hypothetical protein
MMRQTGHRPAAMVSRSVRDAQFFRDAPASKLGLYTERLRALPLAGRYGLSHSDECDWTVNKKISTALQDLHVSIFRPPHPAG